MYPPPDVIGDTTYGVAEELAAVRHPAIKYVGALAPVVDVTLSEIQPGCEVALGTVARTGCHGACREQFEAASVFGTESEQDHPVVASRVSGRTY